jgi:hypothetical protein
VIIAYLTGLASVARRVSRASKISYKSSPRPERPVKQCRAKNGTYRLSWARSLCGRRRRHRRLLLLRLFGLPLCLLRLLGDEIRGVGQLLFGDLDP